MRYIKGTLDFCLTYSKSASLPHPFIRGSQSRGIQVRLKKGLTQDYGIFERD
jgi:hypothetical protein